MNNSNTIILQKNHLKRLHEYQTTERYH
jgi:hypothetical protein